MIIGLMPLPCLWGRSPKFFASAVGVYPNFETYIGLWRTQLVFPTDD
jgi:hypothetical protein